MKDKIASIAIIVAFIGGGWLLYTNRYNISDWWRLRSYTPTPLIQSLADSTAMSDYGERLFFVYYPQLQDKKTFNDFCDLENSGLILGCYTSEGIYILDVEEPKLEQVEQVTAAHEMLHAAYERLSNSERRRIDSLLIDLYESLDDERIEEIVAQYVDRDPGSINNELHSILGTEVADVGSELEQYYSRYFDDRSVVVKISQEYEQVFVDLEERIGRLESRLTRLLVDIESLEAELAAQQDELNSRRAELDSLLANEQIEEYNSRVPSFNALVGSYNQGVSELDGKITTYNRLAKELEEIAIEQNELINSLDSHFEPIQ